MYAKAMKYVTKTWPKQKSYEKESIKILKIKTHYSKVQIHTPSKSGGV